MRFIGIMLAAGGLVLSQAHAQDEIAYGEYLSSECATCHRLEAATGGIPPLGNLPEEYFIAAMQEYRGGMRDHAVMVSVATSLDETQIAALAAYYASLPPSEPGRDPREVVELEAFGQYLAGECSTCHRLDAPSGGVPALGHLTEDYFVAAMNEYKQGHRHNKVMVDVAKSLDAEQIEALAVYYSRLNPAQ